MANRTLFFGQDNPTAKRRVRLRMRASKLCNACIVLFVVSYCVACDGQQAGDTTITVSGCMIGINGSFKLSTHEGQRYVLKGDHSPLFSYNGMVVEVTGTVKAAKKPPAQATPVTLHVTKVKKLADSCQ